jgi:hypothetical protein
MRLNRRLVSALFGSCLLLCCLPTRGEDAWMFRGNPQHSGVYEAPGLPKFNGVKWKVHTAGMRIGSPAVTEGKIYVASTDGYLYAIDAESGASQLEIRGQESDSIACCDLEEDCLVRGLRWKLLRGRCFLGRIEMEISNRRRTTIRGEAPAWSAASGRDHARSV